MSIKSVLAGRQVNCAMDEIEGRTGFEFEEGKVKIIVMTPLTEMGAA